MNARLVTNPYVVNSLINMYSKCRSLVDAKRLFDNSVHRTVASWNCMMWGYINNGDNETALKLFHAIDRTKPAPRTFVAALTACANLAAENKGGRTLRWLETGRTVHCQAVKTGCCDLFVENTVIDMYMKYGSVREAGYVFSAMKKRDVVSWTALLQGYVDNGQSEVVLEIFEGIFEEAVPDAKCYVVILMACANVAVEKGGERTKVAETAQTVHSRAVRSRQCDIFVETTVIDVFAKCCDMASARRVFNGMAVRNVVSWTALLQGYVDNDESEQAFRIFLEMERSSGCSPNSRTYVLALTACSATAVKSPHDNERWLEKGEAVYSRAMTKHCWSISLDNTLLELYICCGKLRNAQEFFNRMVQRDVISWTCLIRGYVNAGKSELALEFFNRMNSDFAPNARTYVVALTACSSLAKSSSTKWLNTGKEIHAQAVSTGYSDVFVETALLGVYSKAGEMAGARTIFDSMQQRTVVSWNTLLQGYVDNGEAEVTLELFERMETEGCFPDARTYVAAVSACGEMAEKQESKEIYLEKGRSFHSQAVQRCCSDKFVEAALVDMYGKCRKMELARDVFNMIASPDAVSWNCLIRGYVDNGESQTALELVQRMRDSSAPLNASTYVCAVRACGNLMAVDRGKLFHAEIRERGLHTDAIVGTSLVDFYGNCGEMRAAEEAFEAIVVKDVSAWNSLICGYSRQGDAEQALKLLEGMKKYGVFPDGVTFTHVLKACSHAGLMDKGRDLFRCMEDVFGVRPEIMHYNCMVDLLGRGKSLDEAVKIVESMPVEANEVTWTTLLAGGLKK